jgi:autotransporter-associated beta strand protein
MTLSKRFSFFIAACAASALLADSGTWTAASGGNWSETANWQDGAIASGSGSTAFLSAGTGTINNDVADPALALLGLQFAGGGYTLAGGTITLDAAGFIAVQGGAQTVSAPLALSGNTELNVASAQTLALTGELSGAGGVTVRGGRVVLGNAANSYAGATVLVTGILEVASADALGDSSADPANLVLGEGTFRYTGASATLERGYTLLPGVSSNRAAVIEVTDPGATLTVAGKALAPGGVLIKSGEGTLAYTYPGYQELNKSKLPNQETAVITYDANGVAFTNGYASFVVDRGRMILGAPGQTNVITGSAWVGSRTLTSPRLDIIGGVTRFINGYVTVGRGTGLTNSIQSPSMYVNNGAYVTIEGSGLVMDNAQGLGAAHRCRPLLDINNATLKISNDCFLSEDGNATSVVNVANNGSFISDSQNPVRGMAISQSAGAKTDVTFDSGSTGTAYMLRVGQGGTLNMIGNSVFEMDGTPTNVVSPASNLGTVRFSGALLRQRSAKRSSDWFVRLSKLLVGAGNMTVNVSSHAWMDANALPDPASPGGKIIKAGAGTLAPRAANVDLQVNEGKVAMSVDHLRVTNGLSGTLTLASGTALDISGANALADMTVTPGAVPITFSPHSLSSKPDLWRFNGYSMRRWDGMLRLTPDMGSQAGSVFMLRKFTVGTPWTANFAYITWSTGGTPADGFAFVLQNDPRGSGAIGGGGSSLGYAGTGTGGITNSVVVGVDVYNRRMRFGKQGQLLVSGPNSSLPAIAATPLKTYFKVTYDGAGLLTVDMTRSDFVPYRFAYPVNVAAEVGGTEAYVGFAAGTGGAQGQHSIADFTFNNGSTPQIAYCRHGGKLVLAGGQTVTASLLPSDQQNGFVFGKLAYGDQSVIDVTAPPAPKDTPVPSLADQGLWKLNSVAQWKPDGRLALSTNAVSQPGGTAYMTNRYPVASSWVARFGYDLGDANATPADYFTFTLQNKAISNTEGTPNPGFSLMWRYYDGAIRTTQLKVYTNGLLMTVATTNIVPVDLKNGVHANMTVAYDAPNQTLTVSTSQDAGTNVTVITGIDLLSLLGGTSSAYVGFTAATGGSYAENIITDFSFVSAELSAGWPKQGYLAFDTLAGSGTLVKRGTGALGLMGDVDLPSSNTVLKLESGGLVLRKNSLEPPDLSGARSEWVFTPEGKWGDEGTLQFCTVAVNSTGTATTSRRIRVKEPWTVTYSFLFGAKSNPPADATSFFLHNDPRGPGCVGGTTSGAGYTGITKSIALRWYFYLPNNTPMTNTIAIGRNGVIDDGASRQSHAPIALNNGVTDFVIRYNPTTSNLTSIMKQGAVTITNTFTGVNIPTDVGSDYAYLGFGGGCGGAYGEMRIRDFRLTYDTPSDTTANQTYLANVILPAASTNTVTLDTSIPDGAFKIAAANVGDGATLGLSAAQQPGTLVLGAVTQSGDAAYPVAGGCTLALGDVTGGASLTKTGDGTLALAGAVATYTGDTVLAGGTLSLPAALMPSGTDLYVTSGAILNLAFTGKQHVHSLFRDGAPMPGGLYTAAKVSWITGPGALIVTYPPVGTQLFIR